MRLLLALAAGALGYCYYLGAHARAQPKLREELNRWEGEGGNVPSVATPSADPQPPTYHLGDPAVRH